MLDRYDVATKNEQRRLGIMQHNFKLKILIFIILMCVSARANAADIRLITESGGSYRAIVIEGKIEAGDFEKFINIVRDNQGIVSGVYIFSPGGDYYEAMKIGRAMRALELSSTVPMNESGRPSCEGLLQQPRYPENCICASAGFFIHIGSVWRSGTYLAVHRPYFEKGKFGELPEAEAKKEFDKLLNSSRDYMTEMGVPKHIQDDVLGTSSDQALVLDEKTVKTYFWLDLPYRHEWLKNKFSKLSDEEKSRDDGYTQRLIKSGYSYARANLSKEEQADREILRKKKQEESNCRLLFDRQNRISAYEKYFNIKLSR